MLCTNCGKQVPEGAVVCGYCGHRLKSVPVPIPAGQASTPSRGGLPVWLKWLGGMILTGIIVPALLFVGKAWASGQLSDILSNIPFPGNSSAQICDRFVYISDVTVPDGTSFKPGESFDKIWRVQNDGSCTWKPAYQIAFFSGEKMGGPDATPLGSTVAPGQNVDLPVRLRAPVAGGTYRGYWMLRNSNGQMFGFGPEAKNPISVEIEVEVVEVLPTPTIKSAYVAPTPTQTDQRCYIFTGVDVSIVWLDLPKGSTQAQLYAKMPGGVPGLETIIDGQNDNWEYEIKIGDYKTTGCNFIEGYKERLYCDFPMPKGYDATIRPIELYVNECSEPIYKDEHSELPALNQAAASGGGGGSNAGNGDAGGSNAGNGGAACSSGLDAFACVAAGGNYHTTFCTIPPCPAWCVCP